jgi:hypothetical protein
VVTMRTPRMASGWLDEPLTDPPAAFSKNVPIFRPSSPNDASQHQDREAQRGDLRTANAGHARSEPPRRQPDDYAAGRPALLLIDCREILSRPQGSIAMELYRVTLTKSSLAAAASRALAVPVIRTRQQRNSRTHETDPHDEEECAAIPDRK